MMMINIKVAETRISEIKKKYVVISFVPSGLYIYTEFCHNSLL